jgi:hypothetical protein
MIEQPTIHLPYADRDTNLPVSIYLGHLSSQLQELDTLGYQSTEL